MKNLCSLVVVLLLSLFADAQTETVVNNIGATVVEFVTTNAVGIPTTRVLATLVGTSTSQTSSSSTTAALGTSLSQATTLAVTTATQVGPVGQPGTTPVAPGGPTPYQYTTTDANGNQVVLQGVFTPTGPQTVLPAATTTGTVLPYSQWLSMIGTYTAPASAARRVSMPVATGWYYFAATAFAGLVGGAWLIVL
ncbi:hypothetical protein EV363DRAFT_1321845 [Boletus edulis]|nr:hypothetical protein EV363DRAFT_1321845 [Boletus edulis]